MTAPTSAPQTGCSGIYQIEHVASGRKYVGSAVRMKRRLSKHRTDLRAGRHHSEKLQRAWGKYGEGAFVFSVLELVEDSLLLEREQLWIERTAAVVEGFNVCPRAGNCRGRVLSEVHKQRLAEALRGRTRPPEHSAAFRGKPRTAEVRARISAAKKGVPCAPEVVAARKGRKQSAETRAKRAESMRRAWAARKAAQDE